MTHQWTRAEFPQDLKALRSFLPTLLATLNQGKDWYGSIAFQRRAQKTHSVELKQSRVSDNLEMGVIFRIYNGETLFERASDEMDFDLLAKMATTLAQEVHTHKVLQPKPYHPESWEMRLKQNLDQQILSQIPKNVDAQTEVHFGVRFLRNPLLETSLEVMERLNSLIEKTKQTANKNKLEAHEISFMRARTSSTCEDMMFFDAKVNLSQRLFRNSCLLLLMSGPERVREVVGGVGGIEVTDFSDQIIERLIHDLKGLKNADRLVPGQYKILISPSLSGVLAHEAFGHSQEGDTCARGRSKAWNLYLSGEKVGNDHATILNNPAIFENGDTPHGAWGSYFFDEEGWLAQEQVILNQGQLTPPMTNLTSAIRLNVPRTANAKREDWKHGVYTRQTNTYFSAGDSTFDELISKIDNGFFATEAAGGMEDPKGMGIQVGISYLKEVKNGKLTGKVFKGPAGGDIQMTGYTPDILNSILGKSKIRAFSNDADSFRHPFNDVGGCGKYHKELVVAGCGGPYMLLDQVTLG